jgi:hypothetical protein
MSIALAGGEVLSQVGGSSGLIGVITTGLFPSVDALNSHSVQTGWYQYPVQPPNVGLLFQAKLKGYFNEKFETGEEPWDFDSYIKMCRYQGVAFGSEGYNNTEKFDFGPYKEAWGACFDSLVTKPGINEAFSGLIAGAITEEQFKLLLRRNGCLPGDWKWLLPFYSNRITADQAIQLWRRGTMNKEELVTTLKFLKYGVPEDIDDLLELSSEIPGPQDIIRFAVREAFNPQQVQLLQLDKELDQNPEFLAWANAVGLGDITITTPAGKELTANFAKLFWYAHWEQPSPGQCYDFYHKYYADSRYGKSPYLKYASEFNIDHLRNLLKANDYSPAFRDHLAGAANLPYTRIDVRRIRKAGIITKEDVYHNYRASGYDDEHANALTEWVEKDIKEGATNKIKSATKGEFCKAYQNGLASDKDFLTGLQEVGYTEPEAKGELGVCNLKLANNHITEFIKVMKRGFLTGAFTRQEAEDAMKLFDIKQDRIDYYLSIWQLTLNGTRKQVSTQMITGWFLEGIINLDEYTSRLTKLGYSAEDVTRIIQSAQWEQAKRIAKAQRAAATEAQKLIEKNMKDAEKARKQAEQLRRERERALKQAQEQQQKEEQDRFRRFLAGRSEANLRSWLNEGTITDDEVRWTFNQKGWNPADIERWLVDAHQRG